MATAKGKATEREPTVKVDWGAEPPALFVNYATVSAKPEEFALVLCSLSPGDVEEAGQSAPKVVHAKPVSSIRMTPSTFLGLLLAMGTTWNSFASDKPGLPRVSIQKPEAKS